MAQGLPHVAAREPTQPVQGRTSDSSPPALPAPQESDKVPPPVASWNGFKAPPGLGVLGSLQWRLQVAKVLPGKGGPQKRRKCPAECLGAVPRDTPPPSAAKREGFPASPLSWSSPLCSTHTPHCHWLPPVGPWRCPAKGQPQGYTGNKWASLAPCSPPSCLTQTSWVLWQHINVRTLAIGTFFPSVFED